MLREFEGTSVRLETPWEIAVKKLFRRPSTFKLRDVFDLAAVLEHHREPLWSSLPEVEDKLDKVVDRIEHLAPRYEAMVIDDVQPTEYGRRYMRMDALTSVLAFLSDWKTARRPVKPPDPSQT